MTTGGTMKVDATCCDAEVRYPTDYNLLEDGSELIDRLLDKFCARHKAEKPRTHRVSWDAYNESSDLAMQLELYKKRFGMLPQEVQADKLYLGKANRDLIKDCHVDCYNHPLGRPPKDENDRHAEDKRRAIGERNEVEATFGTSKRVYRANDIRAKLDDTADTWIGACFFAKNVMKFLRGLLCLIFAKLGLKAFKRRFSYSIDYLMGVLDPTRGCLVKII